jgi:tetratricopeptide (TPR) repeat protein
MESTRMQQIRHMLLSEPEDEFLNYAFALELEKSGALSEAIKVIEGILLKNETYTGAYYKLGNLFEQTGQKQKAMDTYRKGMEMTKNKNERKAFNELNEALQNLED